MPKASSLEAAILKSHPNAQIELTPGGGGTFVVHINGEKKWDKLADNSGFPDEADFVASI
ncbi:MAG: Rdx family protein [Planctomycetota bacterium]|nr:Rdx family protein [Planctomycetota bacterium]